MKRAAKWLFGAMLTVSATALSTVPADAGVHWGISFGWDGPGAVPFSDPCDYYDYYDAPPPWGLPPDYCDYPVYFGSIYWGGTWYRGPIYYRWDHGARLYWLNGGWRVDGWRGGPPPAVRWSDRGWHGIGPGWGPGHGPGWRGPGWHGGPHDGWDGPHDDRHDDGHHDWGHRDRGHHDGGWHDDGPRGGRP